VSLFASIARGLRLQHGPAVEVDPDRLRRRARPPPADAITLLASWPATLNQADIGSDATAGQEVRSATPGPVMSRVRLCGRTIE